MILKRLIASFLVAFLALFSLLTIRAYAADPLDPVCKGSGINSAACQSRTPDNPLVGPSGILTKVIQIIVMITAVASVIMIMVGGFSYITSTGDPSKTGKAKDTILYAIIGLIVAIFGQVIVSFVLNKIE